MENLNAEQIKKALECWVKKYKSKYYTNHAKDALALITSQEQTIKELTVENERLSQSLANISQSLANSKADTVRKMQERINALFDSDSDYFRSSHGYIRSVVDQIAKEMLESGDG